MKHGVAFPDSIRTEKIKRYHHRNGEREASGLRSKVLLFVLAVVAGVLFFRVVSLQIVKGSYYRSLSDSNRIRTKIVYAPRGVLFDRNNIPLVFNVPGFRQIIDTRTRLLSRDKALELIAKDSQHISVDSLREYPYKEATAHVLGYVGQITKEELANPNFKEQYLQTDLIGKSGLEYQYEHFLRGTNGKQLIEVDAAGKEVRVLGETDPMPGNNLQLTLDMRLQRAVFEAMKGTEKGAAIVSTPNGEILSIVSMPSFDPNLFTLDESYKATNTAFPSVEQILTGGSQPLLDRSISGTYPPGSTFKIVMAAGALESKKIDERYEVDDRGKITIGPYSYSNWYFTQYGRTEGKTDVKKALARSNDIFFYELAAKIGLDTIVDSSYKMGVGRKLGIDLPGEAVGVLPDEKWKEKNIGEDWYLGDTYIYGIGQGYLLTTPLQVNAWTQVVANGGTLYQPRLVKNSRPEILTKDFLSDKSISLVREGMITACDPGGTAWPLFDFKVKNPKLKIDNKNITQAASSSADMRHVVVACKTGTAQHGGEETPPHAWITLFAPAYDPEIVVTILKESAGEGSTEAGPVAKKILEAWFSQR